MTFSIRILLLISVLLISLGAPSKSYATTSLQQQIDEASPGTTITMDAGVYYENLTITKPLRVVGKGRVVLISPTDEAVISILETKDVELQHLTLEAKSSKNQSTGIVVKNSEDISIQQVELTQFFQSIDFFRVKESLINNVGITGPKGHFANKSNGITLTDTADIEVNHVRIEHVLDGLYMNRDRNSVIHETDISQSRYAIHLMYSQGTAILQNHLYKNVTGIMHMMTSHSQIRENVIEKHHDYNGFGMVLFAGNSIEVEKNQIRSNQGGISFQQIDSSSIMENVITNNQTALQFQLYGEANQFAGNDLFGNIVSATSDQQGATLLGNYWDDYNGMDFDANGYGDTLYQSSDSYAKLMVKRNEFQVFFESPAVATLNQIEKQLTLNPKNSVSDAKPLMHRSRSQQPIHINWIMLLVGTISIVGGIGIWRKIAS
ncbi:nitrous oxide reductase family maturation protein NosD [Paenisporosarcina macmurdoensis]|uniref:Nitrous oxide reductase family maturation protein NosD n=1 Tax=Paenisporosarcina macmurdoensis TaxID=212659 RepID=A0ABW1L9P7_9BACL